MAYDAARGEALLVGGDANPDDRSRGSVWAWSGTAWRATGEAGPGWRTMAAMAYDSHRGRTILMGGTRALAPHSYAAVADSDTWSWNGTTWTKLTERGPGPVDHAAMAYDSAHDMIVLQGGVRGQDAVILPGATWGFDGNSWKLLASGADGPGPRAHAAMAYDSRRQRTVLYGGWSTPDADPVTRAQTWEWDGTRWTLRTTEGPGPRGAHCMAYDAANGMVVLFGGADDPRTWGWDGARWRVLAESGPPPRGLAAMVWDSRRRRVVLYGGGHSMNDLWEWDGKRWMQVPSPTH